MAGLGSPGAARAAIARAHTGLLGSPIYGRSCPNPFQPPRIPPTLTGAVLSLTFAAVCTDADRGPAQRSRFGRRRFGQNLGFYTEGRTVPEGAARSGSPSRHRLCLGWLPKNSGGHFHWRSRPWLAPLRTRRVRDPSHIRHIQGQRRFYPWPPWLGPCFFASFPVSWHTILRSSVPSGTQGALGSQLGCRSRARCAWYYKWGTFVSQVSFSAPGGHPPAGASRSR